MIKIYNGTPKKDEIEMRKVYSSKLCELLEKHNKVVALEADLMNAITTDKIQDKYPERVINCGIMEANMIGVAAGMSIAGKYPFAHTFTAFASRRCFDQLFMSGAYQKNNIKIIASDAGVTAAHNGGTHMSFEDMGIMRGLANTVVLEVTDATMFENILEQVATKDGFYWIRTIRKNASTIYEKGSTFEIGKGNLLKDGSDITLIANGIMVAEALKEVIEQGGGRVLNKAEAARIEVVDKQVKRVVTTDGRSFSAPYYISATHVGEMLRIADDSAFPKSYVNRLRSIPGSYSIFSLFIELKEGVFPYINHTCYYQTDYEHVWHLGEYDAHQWPYGFMYMTPPDVNQGATATHLIVNCIMPFDVVRRWEDTKTGKRGAEYKAWKLQHQNRVIAGMEKIYPEFRQMIKHVHAASPLTVRDYYHSTEGSIYGFAKDCENFLLSQVPIFTKVRNLFLTGQCVSLHGICGVPLSAINTAEAIVGRNKIIEKL